MSLLDPASHWTRTRARVGNRRTTSIVPLNGHHSPLLRLGRGWQVGDRVDQGDFFDTVLTPHRGSFPRSNGPDVGRGCLAFGP